MIPIKPDASTRETVLTLLLYAGHATAGILAGQLQVSVQVMRRHLRGLEQDGLVESTDCHNGIGRPSNLWRLTDQGRCRFPDGSQHFAMGLLHAVASQLGPDQLHALLHQQASDRARYYRSQFGDQPLPQRMKQLVELRRREGYMAECEPGDDRRSWLLREFHCSVARIAEHFPMVCDQELHLYRSAFPDCRVERVHWMRNGDHYCGFRLEEQLTDSQPRPDPVV